MTTRRDFISAIGASLCAVPLPAVAQKPERVYRLGILAPMTPSASDPMPFHARLASRLGNAGYVEGRNLVVQERYGKGKPERLPGLAKELVKDRVDVIVAVGRSSVRAARQATTTIPIVMVGSFDPVAEGFVASLARPGGNITGVLGEDQGAFGEKRVELLTQVVPKMTRIAFLAPADPGTTIGQFQEVERAAAALGIEVSAVRVKDDNYTRAFVSIAAMKPEGLVVASSISFVRDRKPIIELAAKYRLPAMYEWKEQAQDGGLMSYGNSLSQNIERIAAVVERIFKGGKPGELPVEEPGKPLLVINLRTAKALGLTIPQAMLKSADEVIK